MKPLTLTTDQIKTLQFGPLTLAVPMEPQPTDDPDSSDHACSWVSPYGPIGSELFVDTGEPPLMIGDELHTGITVKLTGLEVKMYMTLTYPAYARKINT